MSIPNTNIREIYSRVPVIQVEVITEESKFLGLEPIWNPLLQKSGVDTIFLTFEWLSTWWRHFGKGRKLFIIVVKNQNRIVGFAPLMITSREGFRQIGVIGHREVEYKDFIISHDENREAIIEVIFSTIVKEKSWDFFELNRFREDSPNFSLLRRILSRFQDYRTICYKHNISPYVSIDMPWKNYWKTLKNTFRKDSKRRMRRLNREKGIVSYNQPSDQKEFDFYMDELIKRHIIYGEEINPGYSIFEDPVMIRFYKDLAKQLFTKKWVNLGVLFVSGEVAAIGFGFEYANKYFSYIGAFNHEFSRYSISRFLRLHALENAFSRGLREFDLLMGSESYKFDFNPKVRGLYCIALFRRSLRGYAAGKWFGQIHPRLEKMLDREGNLEQFYYWLRRNFARIKRQEGDLKDWLGLHKAEKKEKE